MFNAPRLSPTRYSSGGTNGFGSFTNENPLASSIYSEAGYSEVDPWASIPTLPAPVHVPSAFSNVLADASVPPIYRDALDTVDPTGTGEVSVSSLIRVMATSLLPAATTDKIVNMVSSRPRVSRLEFYIALALVGLAQESKDISIEQVAYRAQENTLPVPTLDLSTVTSSTIVPPPRSPASLSSGHTHPPFSQADLDPWTYGDSSPSSSKPPGADGVSGAPAASAAPVALTGGLGHHWWKHQAKVEVSVLPEKQGFILARYTAYQVTSDRGAPVTRRYSEFAYLFDCLVRRYPFRILPNLPPKRIGGLAQNTGEGSFLEQRRKGLQRFLNFVSNHPIIREDGLLAVFLTEPSLEAWRKHAAISLEEESVTKRVDPAEEMSIPRDLDEKTALVRARMPTLIEQWTRICTIAERILKRRESAASDLSRLTMTLNALVEQNPQSWRSNDDEFYEGVQQGLRTTSRRLGMIADSSEQRVRYALATSLEALKNQRDLYIATRDLFLRQDRLSGDQVDKLKKRIEVSSHKLQGIKDAKKDGWAAEADKVLGSIEMDQGAIATALSRRVFIRHSIWHELRVVLYNREHTLVTQALQDFARDEREFSKVVSANWAALSEELQTMPLE